MEPPGTPADAEVNGEANTTGSTNSIIEGLTVLWGPNYRDASTPGPPVMVPDFDVVIIHGLHGTLQDPWTSPGSGSSRWLPDAGEGEGRRVMSFGYDASKILAGALTRQAIRKTALSLLNALKAERGDKGAPYTTRSIMFIAHDIGGIILKDALTVAGLKPASYGDIFDFSRVLVFYGCPHWAVDYMDMEDVIAPFIFCHLSENPALVTASVHSVRGLARAIVDINSLFIDIKHIFRSYVISVFAGDINSSSVYQTFDSFHATLGMPFETRVSGGVSTDLDGGVIEKHLIKIQPQVSVDTRTLVYERNLLAIAAPMPSLFSNDTLSHPFSWISENKTYTSWLKQKQPQLLYVYGTTRVRDAAEYIFYDLDRAHQENNNQIVLYFTFNRWDVRRDTIQDMLTCFLAQIIGHFPRLADFVLAQFKRLGEDRSWNDFDLLNWFEYYRLRGEVEGISCVIDRFDQCDEQSREAFFSLISGLAKVHERPWQVVVTSQEPKALSKELSEWPQLDLDSAGGPRQRPAPVRQISASMLAWLPETRSIVQRRPELRGCEPEIQAEILSIDALKHNRAIRNLVLEHMSAQAGWPTRESIKSTLGDVTVMSPEEILNRILDNIPDKKFTELALSWILYSVRAPTVWELATALFYSLDHPDKPDLVPTQEYVDETISRVTAWFGGIVFMEQHEFHIRSVPLRTILESKPPSSGRPNYPWHGYARSAHAIMAKICIEYLTRPRVKLHLKEIYSSKGSDMMGLPTHCDRTNLCDYATQFWTHHLSVAPEEERKKLQLESRLGAFLEQTDVMQTWLTAYWATSNPIKRSTKPFTSPYPVLVGIGLADMVEFGARDESSEISEGLIEACLHGNDRIVDDLLHQVDHSRSILHRALVAAGSKGAEKVWMRLINHIKGYHESKGDHEKFDWNVSLLNRAAWLGLDQVAKTLLDAGCDVDPKDRDDPTTPLLLVARTGGLEVAKVLLEAGADITRTDEEGKTALHLAACFGHHEVVRLLAGAAADRMTQEKKQAYLNSRDKNGVSALYLACLWGNFTTVETLCSLGANPNISSVDDPSDLGWYPLSVAAEEGHIRCARLLLGGSIPANPDVEGIGGTPLRYAVKSGRAEVCQLLLEHMADPNHPSIQPPILYQAVTSNVPETRLPIVKLLVQHQAKVNYAHMEWSSALVRACWSKDPEMLQVVEYLLENGADIDQPDSRGMTPLHVAVRMKNDQLVRLLLDKKADVNPGFDKQRTPLGLASMSAEVTKLLLDRGADPNLYPKDEDPPLVDSMGANNLDVAILLLDHKASTEAPCGINTGWTPLGLAAVWGLPNFVRVLGDHGADFTHKMATGRSIVHLADDEQTLSAVLEFRPNLNVQDNDGNTPLHDVGPSTKLERIKLLVRGGADVNLQNAEGMSPLSHALQEGNLDVARYLLSKGSSVDIASPCYGGPLHLACKRQDLGLIKDLVAAGADPKAVVPGPAGTPLQSALLACLPDPSPDYNANCSNIVKYLLRSGADATSAGGQFGSAVAAAAWKAPLPLLALLLSRDANASESDPMGRQAVHFAALRGTDHLALILERGGNVMTNDKAERNAAHWAAQGGSVEVLKYVLAEGAAINQPDADGWTPLCWAARGGHLGIVTELLNRGAKQEITSHINDEEWTPHKIAKYHSAGKELLALLAPSEVISKEPGLSHRGAGDKGRLSGKGRLHITFEKVPNSWSAEHCDYCLMSIAGFKYQCKSCIDFRLCFKCHNSRRNFHPAGHAFEKMGPEYVPFLEDTDSTSTSDFASEFSEDAESEGEGEDDAEDETDSDDESV